MVDDIRPLSAIRYEGMDARDGGQPAGSCPYPLGSDERGEWLEGWHERDGLDAGDVMAIERFSPREA
jgi:ribosome modulation factor